jgi:hypothetical protein
VGLNTSESSVSSKTLRMDAYSVANPEFAEFTDDDLNDSQ